MKFICFSAFEYFDVIFRIHNYRGFVHHKHSCFYYLYQISIILMIINNFLLICCIRKNVFEAEILHYNFVIHKIFYELGKKNLYFISSLNIFMILMVYFNHFLQMNLIQVAQNHKDDVYDFLCLASLSFDKVLYFGSRVKLLRSYPYLNQRCISDVLVKTFWLNLFSKYITFSQGKICLLNFQLNSFFIHSCRFHCWAFIILERFYK